MISEDPNRYYGYAVRLFSTRLLIKIIVVPILCLTSGIVSAQLEFSNWIIGKNTIMHLEPDGTTSLVNQNGIIGDKYFHTFNSLLSDNNGNPIVKIGERIWRYENGVVIGTKTISISSANFVHNTSPSFSGFAYLSHKS